jgi:hypothetical protein
MPPFETRTHCLVCVLREIECPNQCGVKRLQFKELDGHLLEFCERRDIQCERCNEVCESKNMKQHLSKNCLFRNISCPYLCGLEIPFSDKERHMTSSCNLRPIDCPLQCLVKVTPQQSSEHVQNFCENRRVECPLQCGKLVVVRFLTKHINEVCICRPKFCQFCDKEIMKNCLEKHEKECTLRKVLCTNKCGEEVVLKNMTEHIKSDCKHRFVDCSLQCGLKVRVTNINHHLQNECANRLIDCEFGCFETTISPTLDEGLGLTSKKIKTATLKANVLNDEKYKIKKIPANLMVYHKKYDCAERETKCSLCVTTVKLKYLKDHEENCECKEVNCRVKGCSKKLPKNELENHEVFQCRFRLILCAKGCNEKIPNIYIGAHYQSKCKMRMVDCPLRCGLNMREMDVSLHVEKECLKRENVVFVKNSQK